VADVMEQVAAGTAWETIVEEWRGNVSPDAISEAVRVTPLSGPSAPRQAGS